MAETSLPVTVGVDGSLSADRAVAWAADDAARRDLPLHIVHVVAGWPYDWPYDIPRHSADGTPESLAERGRAVLAAAEQVALGRWPDLAVTCDLVQEGAAFALREQSKRSFEIVVGHRGLGGFASQLLGSTGLQVAGYAASPVVIVRGATEPTHGEIVVGVDLYEDCASLLEHAFETASARGDLLRVIYAFELARHLIDAGDGDEVAEVEASQRGRLAEILEPWRERFPGVKVVEEIVGEHRVAALADASQHADLLVVGAQGHRPLPGVLLGSVSHGVIHHAHCPVTVVRPCAPNGS